MRKKIVYGIERFYTKEGLNNFLRQLKNMGVKTSVRKTPNGYDVQYWKK